MWVLLLPWTHPDWPEPWADYARALRADCVWGLSLSIASPGQGGAGQPQPRLSFLGEKRLNKKGAVRRTSPLVAKRQGGRQLWNNPPRLPHTKKKKKKKIKNNHEVPLFCISVPSFTFNLSPTEKPTGYSFADDLKFHIHAVNRMVALLHHAQKQPLKNKKKPKQWLLNVIWGNGTVCSSPIHLHFQVLNAELEREDENNKKKR